MHEPCGRRGLIVRENDDDIGPTGVNQEQNQGEQAEETKQREGE